MSKPWFTLIIGEGAVIGCSLKEIPLTPEEEALPPEQRPFQLMLASGSGPLDFVGTTFRPEDGAEVRTQAIKECFDYIAEKLVY
jgi:hypothetical protein